MLSHFTALSVLIPAVNLQFKVVDKISKQNDRLNDNAYCSAAFSHALLLKVSHALQTKFKYLFFTCCDDITFLNGHQLMIIADVSTMSPT